MKHRLLEYLQRKGIYPNDKKLYRCLKHQDENPSVVFYPKGKYADYPVLWCPICQETWSVFDISGLLNNTTDFKEMKKDVMETLNITDDYESEPVSKNKPVKPEPVALEVEEARKVYTKDRIIELYKMSKHSRINKEKAYFVKSWAYRTSDGKIIGMDVRFEDGEKGKDIVTFWYNGKSLKSASAPVLVYNLDRITDDKPVLIHEGAKCADLGNEFLWGEFISISWSGGSHKAHLVDWSFLKNHEVFILRDNDDPGLKAANDIKKQLPHAKIVTPPTSGDGDDIEQFLQALTPQELTEHILKSSDITVSDPTDLPHHSPETLPDTGFSEPFKILGMCEGEAYFIDAWGKYHKYKLDNLGKGKLNNICQLSYWKSEFPAGKNGTSWDEAVDYIICASKIKDFDRKKLKGRGAWRTGENICYNDGKILYGTPDPSCVYPRDEQEYIGLNHSPASPELLKRIRDIIFDLSFETKTDAVRTMGWTLLAPFCGALQYRPTILMTGESGHGKTKTQTLFIKPLTNFIHADMRTTSEAGIRRKIGNDARVVFFDEAGKENDKMKLNFDSLMGFIRSNYSDDSPDGFKANIGGEGYVTYNMSSMFGLATTDPTIENVQDENRILRVHFVKPKHTAEEWQSIENELVEILTPDNCHAIRALTWSRLKTIICLTKKLVNIAKKKTNRDYRSSYADMLLASAYIVVWCNNENPSDEEIENTLEAYYRYQPAEENRSESEEYVNRIMDEVVEIIFKSSGREKITLRECVNRIYHTVYENPDGQFEEISKSDLRDYIRYIGMYGLKLIGDKVHIENDNHLIMKITGLGKGYGKLLSRHPRRIEHKDPVTYTGRGSKRGVLIAGLIDRTKEESKEISELSKVF